MGQLVLRLRTQRSLLYARDVPKCCNRSVFSTGVVNVDCEAAYDFASDTHPPALGSPSPHEGCGILIHAPFCCSVMLQQLNKPFCGLDRRRANRRIRQTVRWLQRTGSGNSRPSHRAANISVPIAGGDNDAPSGDQLPLQRFATCRNTATTLPHPCNARHRRPRLWPRLALPKNNAFCGAPAVMSQTAYRNDFPQHFGCDPPFQVEVRKQKRRQISKKHGIYARIPVLGKQTEYMTGNYHSIPSLEVTEVMKRAQIVVICVTLLALTDLAQADVFLVSFGTEIQTGGTIDWTPLGAANTAVANPSTLPTGIDGLTAAVSAGGGGSLSRTNQGTSAGNWGGNFAPGEPLLATSTSGPLNLDFSSPIQAVGAQIQADVDGLFTATIGAYDSNDSLLNFFTVTGLSTDAGDNSAIFLGLSDTSNTIAAVDFSIAGVPADTAFAISSPVVQQFTAAVPTSTGVSANTAFVLSGPEIQQHTNPEPSSLVIFGLGAGITALGCTRRPRRSRRVARK